MPTRTAPSTTELVDFLFDVLNHLERERWIKANAFSDWYDVSDDGVGEED